MNMSRSFITGCIVAMFVLSAEVSARSRSSTNTGIHTRSRRRRQPHLKPYTNIEKSYGKRAKMYHDHNRNLARAGAGAGAGAGVGWVEPSPSVERPPRCPKKLEHKRWGTILSGYYSEEYWEERGWAYPEGRFDWAEKCIEYWEAITPSASPSHAGPATSKPTSTPTKAPSVSPTVSPTPYPSASPTTPEPTRAPKPRKTPQPTPAPTLNPTEPLPESEPEPQPEPQPETPFQSPDSDGGIGVIQMQNYIRQMEDFEITFTFPTTSTNDDGGRKRKLSGGIQIDQKVLWIALHKILDAEYKDRLPHYNSVSLRINSPEVELKDNASDVSFVFGGECSFNALDAGAVPNENDLKKATISAFSRGEARGELQQISVEQQFSFFAVKLVGNEDSVVKFTADSTEVDYSNNDSTNDKSVQNISSGTSITIASCVIAVSSTIAALGLIYMQRRKMNETGGTESPTKSAKDENSPKSGGGLRLRSPFPMAATPAAGTKKYFCRLDDESVASKSQTNGFVNPNVSCVDSSFSRDEESSLEAPSMTGLSSICENSRVDAASVDAESLANMSALDEVRLAKVLDLGPDTDNYSLASTVEDSITKRERRSTFSKLWYGGRKKTETTPTSTTSPAGSRTPGEIVALAPSLKDSSSKKKLQSPLRLFPLEPKKDKDDAEAEALTGSKEKETVDDVSLLGDQSNKGEYYAQNDDESNLIYNMLGERSINSYESDSVDFNEMYNGMDASSFEDGSSMGASSKMSSAH